MKFSFTKCVQKVIIEQSIFDPLILLVDKKLSANQKLLPKSVNRVV